MAILVCPWYSGNQYYQNGSPKIVVAKQGEVGAYFTHPVGASLDLDDDGLPKFQIVAASLGEPEDDPVEPPQNPGGGEDNEQEDVGGGSNPGSDPVGGIDLDYDAGNIDGIDGYESEPIIYIPSGEVVTKSNSGKKASGKKSSSSKSAAGSKGSAKKKKKAGGGGGGSGGGGGGSGSGSSKKSSSSSSSSSSKTSKVTVNKPKAKTATEDGVAQTEPEPINENLVLKVTVVDISKLRSEQLVPAPKPVLTEPVLASAPPMVDPYADPTVMTPEEVAAAAAAYAAVNPDEE